jgi:hypothetical protein
VSPVVVCSIQKPPNLAWRDDFTPGMALWKAAFSHYDHWAIW